MKTSGNKPLVYSCSGCSSAAQMANHLALQMNGMGIAEMSCIAGVGGHVPPLVRLAKSGRPVWVIDGCALACAKACLEQHQITPKQHHILSSFGIKKRKDTDFSQKEALEVLAKILETEIRE